MHVSLQEKPSQGLSGKSNIVDITIKKSLYIQGWSNCSALRNQTPWMSFLDGSELCHPVIQTFFSTELAGSQRGHPSSVRGLPLPVVEVN